VRAILPTAAARRWSKERSFRHDEFPVADLAAVKRDTVSVCVPAKECAPTVATVVAELVALQTAGVVDEVIVVDADSADGTGVLAAEQGARVVSESDLLPEFGPVQGKGDAMWRALSVARGDVVAYVDGDTVDFQARLCRGLIGPLLFREDVAFVKGFFRRPFAHAEGVAPEGGGRVTELTARPLLTRFWPALSAFRQPLAGETAARRWLLDQLPFSTGYAVETAMLIDAYNAVGLDALAQVDLDVRQNRHQTLGELAPMAYAVLRAVTDRLESEGRLAPSSVPPLLSGPVGDEKSHSVVIEERPPMASVLRAPGDRTPA
jgi:glucosyl-3-phosphoglycerate synthase